MTSGGPVGLHGFVGFELTGSARLVFDDPEAVFTDLARRGFAQLFVEVDAPGADG